MCAEDIFVENATGSVIKLVKISLYRVDFRRHCEIVVILLESFVIIHSNTLLDLFLEE